MMRLGTAKATEAGDQHGRFLWRNYFIARWEISVETGGTFKRFRPTQP
jgi:hypothetical protein